jgi:hypothetical protein
LWIAFSVFLILLVAIKQYVASRQNRCGMPDLALDKGAPMWAMPSLPSTSDQVRYDKSV